MNATGQSWKPNLRRTYLRRAYLCAVSNGVPRQSFYVALVVGTILNAINQGDAILNGRAVDWLKLVLTYVVPYGVCTYGAVSAQLMRGDRQESRDDPACHPK